MFLTRVNYHRSFLRNISLWPNNLLCDETNECTTLCGLSHEQVLICLTEEGQHFDICCRVNADDPGREDEAVQLIWAHLGPLLKSMSYLLASWPGLFTEVRLSVQ